MWVWVWLCGSLSEIIVFSLFLTLLWLLSKVERVCCLCCCMSCVLAVFSPYFSLSIGRYYLKGSICSLHSSIYYQILIFFCFPFLRVDFSFKCSAALCVVWNDSCISAFCFTFISQFIFLPHLKSPRKKSLLINTAFCFHGLTCFFNLPNLLPKF